MSFKSYFKRIFDLFSIFVIIQISVITASLINVIDTFDVVLKFMYNVDLRILIIVFITILTNGIVFLHLGKCFTLIKTKSVNEFDAFLILCVFTLSATIFICFLTMQLYLYKVIILFVLLILALAMIAFRININSYEINAENECCLLKDIYDNKLPFNVPVTINDIDVDYDLFERTAIVDDICASINTTKNSFVIGLEGTWGSGKTTIINNVKKKLVKLPQNIIIDDFEPWSIGTQEALLLEMYEKIFYHAKGRKIYFTEKKILRHIICEVVDKCSEKGLLGELLKNDLPLSEDSNKLKKKISSFLEANNKRIIFVVDNLDRTSSDNIIFILKIISNILDIPYVTFILSYDKERMDNVLSDYTKINSNYIEKIINKVITIPNINSSIQKSFYSKCISNLLDAYEISFEKRNSFHIIENYLYNKIKNTRQFIRYINSVFPFLYENHLDFFDLISIKTIQFFEPSIYNQIYDNRRLFVSFDRDANYEYEHMSSEKIKKLREEFFKEFFNGFSLETIDLICAMFPDISNYASPTLAIVEHKKPNIASAQINYNICSYKYFELYFVQNANFHVLIGEDVKQFLSHINSSSGKTDMEKIIIEKANSIPEHLQNNWCEILVRHIEIVNEKSAINFAIALFNNNHLFNINPRFMGLDARSWIIGLIADILKNSNVESINSFLQGIGACYNKLEGLCSLLHFMGIENNPENQLIQIVNQSYMKMCGEVLRKNIDLYDSTNYSFHNIYGLIYKKNNIDSNIKIKYISNISDTKNIYKILADIITVSISNHYTYAITEKDINLFFDNENAIDNLLKDNPPKNDSESFILQVYNHYKNKIVNPNDVFNKYSISLNYPFDFKL